MASAALCACSTSPCCSTEHTARPWRLERSTCMPHKAMGTAIKASHARTHFSIRASAGNGVSKLETQVQNEAESSTSSTKFDVSSNCVTPVYRSTPWKAEASKAATATSQIRILFVSEGNVCRSVLAEAFFNAVLKENGLSELVECESKGSRNYNEGEEPDERVAEVAQDMGVSLPEGMTARVFVPAEDIVAYDLVVVMDKFNASDVLKEVSVYDTIHKSGNYSVRVRKLGEFRTPPVDDIDDPLYGNDETPEEMEYLRATARMLQESCKGLVDYIIGVRQACAKTQQPLKEAFSQSICGMQAMDWLVPPMLQKR
eukprot:jgi/Chlat1/2249/Chrsp17S02563